MNKEEKKERKHKRRLKFKIKLSILIIIIILYAIFIGPKGIFIKEYQVDTKKIDDSFHGFKIVQFSDLNYGSTINKNEVKELYNKIKSTKPDVVIFTGDLINKKYKLTEDDKNYIIKIFDKINAPFGKFYVTGEEDDETAKSILNLSHFTNIDNDYSLVYNASYNPILLIGNEACEGYFNDNKDTNNYKILVLHNPNDFDKVKKYNFDMVIAGHTLNGQINIPKIKDLFINTKYDKSYQKVDGTNFYVNNGLGTKNINIRMFNHPTINLYRLYKIKQKSN